MKITHVISDSNVGGAGILLCTLLSGLADEFDFEVILPEGSRLASRLPAEKIKITELPVAPDKSFSPRDISTFYRYLRATRPDVVHTHASLTCLFATPRTAACQASLSFTIFQSLLKFISIELLMPSNHLILCRPLLLLPPIPPSIRVF